MTNPLFIGVKPTNRPQLVGIIDVFSPHLVGGN